MEEIKLENEGTVVNSKLKYIETGLLALFLIAFFSLGYLFVNLYFRPLYSNGVLGLFSPQKDISRINQITFRGLHEEATKIRNISFIVYFSLMLLNIVWRIMIKRKSKMVSILIWVNLVCLLSSFVLVDFMMTFAPIMVGKPVIYLYPKKPQQTMVQLYFEGQLDTTYPKYDENIHGWDVMAYPDGRIIKDNKEYSYLFWDGMTNNAKYDMTKGFVVKGEDTAEFLEDTLGRMGLTPKEYNEFIVYWLPLMKNNRYNLIHFADSEYTDIAKLEITPEPDSELRVFMVFKPLNTKINVEPQEIKHFDRHGFTVVEWGGTELR